MRFLPGHVNGDGQCEAITDENVHLYIVRTSLDVLRRSGGAVTRDGLPCPPRLQQYLAGTLAANDPGNFEPLRAV